MSKNKPKLSFIGYSTIDVNVAPNGTTTLPGGAAYFGALAASRIIDCVGLVTKIGGDYNKDWFRGRLLSEGIRTIQSGKTARSTQTYFSEVDLTNRDISVERGVAALLTGQDIPKKWLPLLKTVHIATMIPSQQLAILEFIRKFAPQAKISIDTDSFLLGDENNKSTIIRSFEQSDIVFANRKEYEILRTTIDKMPEAVVKLDQDGAVYMQKGKTVAQSKARKVNAVDVTGAGDIFAGTFLACLIAQNSKQDALNEATSIATEAVTQVGINHIFKK